MKRKRSILTTIVFVFVFSCLFGTTGSAVKPDRIPPTAPANMRAVFVADTKVSLAWNASTDNKGVKSYDVYRDNAYIGNSITTTYISSGLTPATSYRYFVRARDAAGNVSNASNTITVTTLQSTASVTTPTPTPTLQPVPTSTPVIKTAKVVGYYAAWDAYSGFTPDKIDASKLTHVNYAFANIGSDLKIALGYPDIDPSNFSKINVLKKLYPSLKTLISVGGWSWSGKFSDVALTDSSRTVFADSCVSFIVQYGFDGVDIDWEYPVGGGATGNVTRPEDKQNFTLLLQKMREKLNARSSIDGKTYLLTIAGGCGSGYVNNVEPGLFHQYLDYGNIMTYDIHGTWDSYTDFNSPLYNNSDTSPQYKWSVDSGVNAWIRSGFPAEKLIVGVPFYGYKYTMVKNANNGLYQFYSGGSSITYADIAANYLNAPGYVRYYHQQSMVPWLFNGSTFISYEDEQSMAAKAQYIKSKGVGGAMIWELSQDPNRVLLNSLYKGLQ